jgi:hypothetical protein
VELRCRGMDEGVEYRVRLELVCSRVSAAAGVGGGVQPSVGGYPGGMYPAASTSMGMEGWKGIARVTCRGGVLDLGLETGLE